MKLNSLRTSKDTKCLNALCELLGNVSHFWAVSVSGFNRGAQLFYPCRYSTRNRCSPHLPTDIELILLIIITLVKHIFSFSFHFINVIKYLQNNSYNIFGTQPVCWIVTGISFEMLYVPWFTSSFLPFIVQTDKQRKMTYCLFVIIERLWNCPTVSFLETRQLIG